MARCAILVSGLSIATAALLLGGPAPARADFDARSPEQVDRYDETGLASYYSHAMAGRPTAIGEPYDPEGLTGAHRSLPLPSYVEVTALDTGRSVIVRINDRGPVSRKRVVDLSYGAARALGIVQSGVARVGIRRIDAPDAPHADQGLISPPEPDM